jgi:methylsterol monooxygenase
MLNYIIIPFLCHFIPYWTLCYRFYLLDYKYLDKNHVNWARYSKAIKGSLINQLTIHLPTLYFTESLYENAVIKSIDDTYLVSFIKIFCIINFTNILFYIIHKLLHTRILFNFIHYKHHEFIEPIAPASIYAHWIEHLLTNTLAFLIPFYLIGINYIYSLILIVLGTTSAILSHVPYKIKSNHNAHLLHHKLYKYNYGFGGYLDKLLKTYK